MTEFLPTFKYDVETQHCFVICRITKLKLSVFSVISSLTTETRLEGFPKD